MDDQPLRCLVLAAGVRAYFVIIGGISPVAGRKKHQFVSA